MYLLFRHENIASLQPSSSNPAKAPAHMQISNTEQQLEKHPTDRTVLWEELPKSTAVNFPTDNIIQWVELPKVTPEVTRNTSQEELKEMVSMAPLLPGTAMTTSGFSTILDKDDEIKKGTDALKANLFHICPTESGLLEIPTTAEQIDNSLLISDSAWDKPSNNNEFIINDDALDLKGHSDPVVKNSTGVQFIPLYAKSDIELKQFTLLGTFPVVTQIAGMPSKTIIKEVHWLMDEKPLWERRSITVKILQSYVSDEDENNKKETLRMAPSCPREARNPGFPSAQPYSLFFYGTNMVDICPGCPSQSIVSGLPSLGEDNNRTWITQEEPLLEKQIIAEPLLTVSSVMTDEMKLMGALLPSCPTHSCIQGIPSILQPTTAQREIDVESPRTSCFKTSSSDGISSAIEELSKKWAPGSKPIEFPLPEVETGVSDDKSNDMKDIAALALPFIRGFSSAMKPTVNYNLFSEVSLLPTCPATSSMSGFPSIQKPYSKYWNTTYELLWERQIKYESLILLEHNKMDKDMKGIIPLAPTCPTESVIYGFPSISKPRVNTSMVCISMSCSKVSQIPGFPSFPSSENLKISKETLFEPQMKEKQVLLIDRCGRDEGELKTMVSLAPTCPKEAWAPGFPCLLSPPNIHFTPNITSLLTMCSQASKIPGFSSVDFITSVKWEWVTEKGSVMKRLPKSWAILDTKNYNKKIMKNIVSILPSCPKKSSISGFPCVSNPKIVYYGQNVVNLFPLCPLVSVIPGFSSVEMHNEGGWVEMDSLMLRAQKNSQTILYSSPINPCQQKNMHTLVPSCPHKSNIPGFPSVPRYNMLSLVRFCPKVSSMPGFASFKQASKLQWIFSPNTLCDKLSKETLVVIHSPNQDGESVKKMMDLAPSCPEASRIPGFPSSPQTKSKIEPSMVNFRPCCPSASIIKGFGSMCTTLSPEWPKKAKPILRRPQEKIAEMIMPFVGQDQLCYCKAKSMTTLVTSCPKEARVRGFPSAQVVNKQPNMVSMYTSAPCVSHVPGFPSARMLSVEFIEMQTRTTHCKILFENLQQKKSVSIAKCHAEHSEEERNYMVAMLPSCPRLTQIPGFPSVSQENPTETKTITLQSPCSIKCTSQEPPHIQSTQSHLKDERIPDVPPSYSIREKTPLVNGETFIA